MAASPDNLSPPSRLSTSHSIRAAWDGYLTATTVQDAEGYRKAIAAALLMHSNNNNNGNGRKRTRRNDNGGLLLYNESENNCTVENEQDQRRREADQSQHIRAQGGILHDLVTAARTVTEAHQAQAVAAVFRFPEEHVVSSADSSQPDGVGAAVAQPTPFVIDRKPEVSSTSTLQRRRPREHHHARSLQESIVHMVEHLGGRWPGRGGHNFHNKPGSNGSGGGSENDRDRTRDVYDEEEQQQVVVEETALLAALLRSYQRNIRTRLAEYHEDLLPVEFDA